MASVVDTLVRNFFSKATVTYKVQIAPKVYHIRIQSDSLKGHHYIPGEHLRLFVGIGRDTAMDSKLRTYSIWDHDGKQGMADLAICTHSTGIGAAWISQVSTGEDIHYMGPRAKLTIDYAADASLLIGDASALSHLYAIRRHTGPGKKVFGIAYGHDTDDHYADIDGSRPFQFLMPDGDPAEALIKAADALKDKLGNRPVIYLGGDARVCKSLGRHFRERWQGAEVRAKGFWMPGKTGMD